MKTSKYLLVIALVTVFSAPTSGQTRCKNAPEEAREFNSTLVLTQYFVENYKNRALLTTNMNVDKYSSPHTVERSGNDGDIHIAGRDSVVKLPFVAEIMNARYFLTRNGNLKRDFRSMLKEIASTQALRVTGVWRLWFEHPGKTQVMGKNVPIAKGSSPPHVFEIHPVTEFRGINTLASLIEIKDYREGLAGEPKSYEAHSGSKTVPYYECIPSSIGVKSIDGKAGIAIASTKAQYNYTDLFIELTAKPKKYDDCYIGLAHIYDAFEGGRRLTSKPRRMIFVNESPPAERLSEFRKGTRLRVLGIPRINLDIVSGVAKTSKGKNQSIALPYEIIVAALLEEEE